MTHPTTRRQLFTACALGAGALLVLALPGCASLRPGPRTVDIPEAKLVEAVTRQFPHNSRLLDLFDVSLTSPRVRLIPAENRIGTQLDFAVGAPLVETRTQRGTLTLSYGLRLEPVDNTVRLTGVRMEGLDLPGMSPAHAARFRRLGTDLVENLLPDLVVYRLKPKDLETAQGWGYQPGGLQVVPGGLQLRLDPVQQE
jgi:hypothetical protein